MACRWGLLVGAGLVVAASTASAAVVTLDNGVAGDGHVSVPVDEYGVFGWLIAPPQKDSYDPPGAEGPSYVTYAAGLYVFATTPADGKRTSVAFNTYRFWHGYLEPGDPQADGLSGDRVVSRVVTMANTSMGAGVVQSAFAVEESATGPFRITFALRQELTFDSATMSSKLEQTYVVTNAGTLDANLVIYVHGDPALPFGGSDWNNDIVGVGAGRCYVYARESASPTLSIALADGGSTVPVNAYYAGKCGVTPSGGLPAFESTQDSNLIWTSNGIPTSWVNELATVGANMTGESPASPPPPAVEPPACATIVNDAGMGHQYRFTLAAGASETLRIHRYWGTITPTCPPPPTTNGECGNGAVDSSSETCDDGGDSQACDADCSAVECGDGYRNAIAEACDEGGDTVTCNANCAAAACGDGYVNAAAGEECEGDDTLCDPAMCTYTFSLGGGCGGCASNDAAGAGLLPLALLWLLRRRRR